MNMAPALMSFCEQATQGFPVYPADTWSNLAPFLAGAFLLRQGMAKNGPRSTAAIGAAGLIMAVGSIVFHGTATRIGELVDVLGMSIWIAVIFGLSMTRLGINRIVATVVAGLCVLAVMATAHFAPTASLAAFTLFAVGVSVTEAARAQIAGERITWLLLAAAAVAIAFGAWYLDERRIVCDPENHVLSLHSVWHILNALPLLFVANHFRQANNGTSLALDLSNQTGVPS